MHAKLTRVSKELLLIAWDIKSQISNTFQNVFCDGKYFPYSLLGGVLAGSFCFCFSSNMSGCFCWNKLICHPQYIKALVAVLSLSMLPRQPRAGCLVVLVSWTISWWPEKPGLACMRGGRSLQEEVPGVLRGRKWGENCVFWGTFPHNARERHGVGGTSGREGSNGSGKDIPGFYHRGKKYSSRL